MKLGILTSGGDCSGLNAVIRAIGLYAFENIKNVEIVGIPDGYSGLISGECFQLKRDDLNGIIDRGGTILGTSRQPYKMMTVAEDGPTRLQEMCANYKKMGLDCLFTLGGAGTHKTAALLYSEGCNVIGLPKTIDNDIYGTDVTFGFQTAVETATECIDRIRTTAAGHGRTIIVEVMGNKAGWLALNAGIAAGADMILLPEIPFSEDIVCDFISKKKAKSQPKERIAGWDLFVYEMEKLNRKGGKCFFMGSSDKVLALICRRVAVDYPNIQVETYSPPYKSEFSEVDNQAIVQAINQANPDLLWIGMTAPKQEKWIYAHWDELNIHCHVGTIGAVFDFFAGTVKRAPLWWQEHGLEWAFRLLREPKRMWRRYIIGNVCFLWNISKEQ